MVGAQNVTAGSSITVYAITRDAYGNFVANLSATWSLQNISGGVVSSDLTPTTGTSSTFTGHLVGSANIQVVAGGFTGQSGVQTVIAGSATQTRVETAADGSGSVVGAQNVTAGDSITVYAITRDTYGNFVANPSATWSLQGISGGVVSGDLVGGGASAVFTGHLVGSANIQAVASGFTGQSGVQTVIAGAATQTRVETAASGSGSVVGAQNVTAGNSITVYAITRDAQGNFVANPSAAWSLQNISGGVVSGDLTPTTGTSSTFSGHEGSANIQAVASGFTGQSGLQTVIAGAASTIALTSGNSQSGAAGTALASPFVVTVTDANGIEIGHERHFRSGHGAQRRDGPIVELHERNDGRQWPGVKHADIGNPAGDLHGEGDLVGSVRQPGDFHEARN